jgi:hypothetical protein
MSKRDIDDLAQCTPEELLALARDGLKYRRGLKSARSKQANYEQAEAFRRRLEMNWMFRSLSEADRKHPAKLGTVLEIRDRLSKIGIKASERTILRDYRALGGAKALRSAKPFAPGEDSSSPFLDPPPEKSLKRRSRKTD